MIDEENPLELACGFYVGELKDDSAAVRSIRRKYEELYEQFLCGDLSMNSACDMLRAEFDDCLPA
jgi:hypothetical protein